MERKTSFFSFLALAKASGPQGYQSTGLWACWRRYGLISPARRLGLPFGSGFGSAAAARDRVNDSSRPAAKNLMGLAPGGEGYSQNEPGAPARAGRPCRRAGPG